jgi:phosphate transport system protein
MKSVPRHLQVELDTLRQQVLALCGAVEKQLALAARAVDTRDAELARQVVDGDEAIDEGEVQLEEECLKALALYQPVAVDLRLIVAILKMNNELERIGDLAVSIAERAVDLVAAGGERIRYDFGPMAARVQGMLRKGPDALVSLDVSAALAVCEEDDEIDIMHRRVFDFVSERIRDGKDPVQALLCLISISRSFERIADHATNIAEDVLYMVTGDIVRHHVEEFSEETQGGQRT